MVQRERGSRSRIAISLLVAVVVVLGGLAVVNAVFPGDETETHAWGRQQLAAVRQDPVLQFRAPGTELRSSSSAAAGIHRPWFGSDEHFPTSVSQTFGVAGDPASAVEAYLDPAAAAGWRLVETACSPPQRMATAVLAKDFPGFSASLVLTGRSPLPPASGQLEVKLTVGDPPSPSGEYGVGPQPGSLHCIRQVNADDPDLSPPSALPARTPGELCALLTLAEVQAVIPEVQRAVPEVFDGRPNCFFRGPHGVFGTEDWWIRLSDPFDTPRAAYLDRRLSTSQGDDRLFLLTSEFGPSLDGAWIATARGPVELHFGVARLDEERTLALARSVQARADSSGG